MDENPIRKGGHRIGSSLKQRLGLPVGFVQYPPKPIEDNRHLHYTVRYILRQRQHHDLELDPRAEASSVADLLGLRVLGRYTVRNIRRWLPRLRRTDVLELSGLSAPEPLSNFADATNMHEAMRAAGCINDLTGASGELIALRTATVAAAGSDLSTKTLASQLGINMRTVQRLRARQPDPDLVRAIRLQLGLGDRSLLAEQR